MRLKLFALALLLGLTSFGQTLDSIEGGTFVITGTPDRPVFVNHSDWIVVAVAFRQQSSTRHTHINHFMSMTPDLLIEPEGQRDLLQSADTIAIRIDPGEDGIRQEAGTPIAVILDLVVTMSGQIFGADSFHSEAAILDRVRGTALAGGDNREWTRIVSRETGFARVAARKLRAVRSERGEDAAKALALHYRSLPVKFWRVQ